MTIIYSKKDNNRFHKEFLIPKDGDINIGEVVLHFIIDNEKLKFQVKKLVIKNALDQSIWEVYNDKTFPSSLLNHFIMATYEHKNK